VKPTTGERKAIIETSKYQTVLQTFCGEFGGIVLIFLGSHLGSCGRPQVISSDVSLAAKSMRFSCVTASRLRPTT
jgi:hypothetical protein